MPAFETLVAADVAALRDARAGHRLVFGGGDRADELNTLAPSIFTGGGGAPVTSAYGQFASLVLGSVVRVPEVGGPAADKVLGRHRCSDQALHRWWTTCIAILSRMDDPQRQAFWEPKQRGPFLSSLAKLRGAATAAELVAFELVDADLQRISMDDTLDVLNFAGLEAWYKSAGWGRGCGLADEEDGTLHVAALVEYYAVGRHNHTLGHAPGSVAKGVGTSVMAAAQRASLAAGHTAATWNALSNPSKAQKALAYLAACSWPSLLDHWRPLESSLVSDMHDMFIYTESGGVGLPAQRELLNTPARTRQTLKQVKLVWGVLAGAESSQALHAAVRRMVEATSAPAPSHITLQGVLLAESMLQKAEAHCSGAEWEAKGFDVRVADAVRLIELRRGVESSAAVGGGSGLAAPPSDAKSGSVAGYAKDRLLDLKSGVEYVATKRQVLAAFAAARVDEALLLALRGAVGAPTAAGGPGARLAPLKVFHDLLLGSKDIYMVDKELESCIPELKRSLPAFWARRAAKALGITLPGVLHLPLLADAMAAPSTWWTKVPDFFDLALVPVREAAGELRAEIFASYRHTEGAPPYQNIAVIGALQLLVTSLLSDVGVLDTAVADVSAVGADLSSPADLFGLAIDFHATAGSMTTSAAKMGALIDDVLKGFGARRGEVGAGTDPKRPLNLRLIEINASSVVAFAAERGAQARGRVAAHELRAAGFTVVHVPPPDAGGRKRAAGADDEGADDVKPTKKAAGKEALKGKDPLKDKPAPKAAEEDVKPELPASAKLVQGGDVLHVTGGLRGPAGCYYQITGEAGAAVALAAIEATAAVCPAWYTALRSGLESQALDTACGNRSHKAGDSNHPEPDDDFKFATRSVKISDYRVNEDGSKYIKPSSKGKGDAGRGKGRGKGGGRRDRGRGAAITALAALSGTSGFVLGPPPSARSSAASVLLTAAAASPTSPLSADPGPPTTFLADDLTAAAAGGASCLGSPQHGPGEGDAGRAAGLAFAESRAIFVADGEASLPPHLGGGGLREWLLRDQLGALRFPLDVVVGEFSLTGLGGELDALAGQLGTALTIDKRPREGPGLHYRGNAQDVLYKRSWRRLFSFMPCTDDALSGAQYFQEKLRDGRLWRGCKLFLWSMCAPAAAHMGEHPRSELKRLLDWPYQVTQPYMFGPGEDGLAEQKETWLYWRGWGDVAPTDLLPPPYVSRVSAVRSASASDRDALKSRSHPGMMRAIAAHATLASIAPTPQPDFASELLKLGANFATRFGKGNLPAGWDAPHVDYPAWVATSIKYEPSPGAREAADRGVRFVSTAAPVSVTGAKRQPSDTDPQALPARSHVPTASRLDGPASQPYSQPHG